LRVHRRASGRSSAGGCAARDRRRTAGAGSSPPPRRSPAGGRPVASQAPSRPRADAESRPRSGGRLEPAAPSPRGEANRLPACGEAYDCIVPKPFIGVRWWLGVAFAVVAATSTAIVVAQFSDRSEAAFRRHGEELTLKDVEQAAKKSPAGLA